MLTTNSHKQQSVMRALANSHPSVARLQRVLILCRRVAYQEPTPMATIGTM